VPDEARFFVEEGGVVTRPAVAAEPELAFDPELLTMLKDSSSAVREHARGALQSIRFYHDEKAHWDRVFAGKAGLTAASAAEALLDQARPGNDPETRVLAIRSLGVLAAPETLPFLITWTKDGDPGVAEAARAAIATIHTRG
jgi:HEAT repeat protein